MCTVHTCLHLFKGADADDAVQITVYWHVSTQKCIINVYRVPYLHPISCCCTALHCRDGIVQNECLHVQEKYQPFDVREN